MTIIPQGYKETEIGVLPKDWDCKTLGQVVNKIIGGGTPSRSVKDFWGNEIPWVTVKDFASFDPFITQEYITKKGLDNSATHLIPQGTLITSTRMGLGKAIIYEVDVSINQDLKAIFPSQHIRTKYLYYWFQNNVEVITRLGSGSTVMGISLIDLKSLLIPIPPLPEQTAIANALSDIDDLINTTQALIAKKKAIKTATMQQLLTPKKDWVEMKLGDVGVINMGQSPLSKYYNYSNKGLPLVQGNADIQNRKTIIRSFTSNVTKKALENDIIFTVRAPVGNVALASFDCCIGRGVCSIRYRNLFIYYYLINIEKYWAELSSGSTFDSINSNELREFKIWLPNSEDKEKDIIETITYLFDDLDKLETTLTKYQSIKQGMMQSLLTGKIRLI
jgi:type I restriction enzyme, S subunit